MKLWKFVLVSVLIVAFAGNVYFWNWQHATGIKSSYDAGFLSGYDEGNQTGYQIGHSDGYEMGNSSGYQLGYSDGNQSGYDIGYSSGNLSGYQDGHRDGNASGYQLGFLDGNETGFADGYIQGVEDGAGRGYTIRDPTYNEAIAFVNSDKTDENEYSETYTCHDFTADFKNNAFEAGYRCGYTAIEFPVYAHAIVCFNTVDEGLLFIEPQSDDTMTLTIGEPYWDRTIYEPPEYDDTIVSFDIIW